MPNGFHKYDEDGNELCLRLTKSSEGLKQSAANWQKKLMKYLIKAGFIQCVKEPCLWRLDRGDDGIVVIEVYVDDMFGTMSKCDSNSKWLKKLVLDLDEKVAPCKYLGEIKHCLGVDIVWNADRSSFSISSEDKVISLLSSFGYDNCTSRATPLTPGVEAKVQTDEWLFAEKLNAERKRDYQAAVGSLLYIFTTRSGSAVTG